MDPQAFRDGIFSQASPLSPYGMLLQTYSDGSLGASMLARPVTTAEAKPAEQAAPVYTSTTEGRSYGTLLLVGAGVLVVGTAAYLVLRRK